MKSAGIAIAAAWMLLLASWLGAQVSESERLERVLQEEKLEKRSELALEYVRGAVERAVRAYEEGKPEQGREILALIVEAAELSAASLEETGKDARKKPKHFKRAEINMRKLIGDMQEAERAMNFDDRPDFREPLERLDELNRALLLEIMKKK